MTLLASTKDDLVTVYDVSRDKHGPARLKVPAYSLPPTNESSKDFTGSALLRHPLQLGNERVAFMRLTASGGLQMHDLTTSTAEEYSRRRHDWSDDVHELEAKSKNDPRACGNLGERAYSEVDMQPVIQRRS